MALNVDFDCLANVFGVVDAQRGSPQILQGQLTRSSKGNDIMIVSGFEYKKDRLVNMGQTQNWRCMKARCRGTAKTNAGSAENIRFFEYSHLCAESECLCPQRSRRQSQKRRCQQLKIFLSQFIIRLKAEEEETRQLVVRARVNPVEALRQARRPQYLRRDENLKALTQGYQTANRIEFLRAVQHHLSKFAFVRDGAQDYEAGDGESDEEENI